MLASVELPPFEKRRPGTRVAGAERHAILNFDEVAQALNASPHAWMLHEE